MFSVVVTSTVLGFSIADHQIVSVYFRDFLALNVYVALCYYKLDYYDVSQVNSLYKSLNLYDFTVVLLFVAISLNTKPICCKFAFLLFCLKIPCV